MPTSLTGIRAYPFCLIAVSACLVAGVCRTDEPYVPPLKRIEVEINPGEFIAVGKRDWTVDDPRNISGKEKTALHIDRGARTVTCEGPEIPVILREKDDTLYMAGYDRATGRLNGDHIPRFSYFREQGEELAPIKRDDFPKELATQNMWVRDPKKLEAVLALDTSNSRFLSSSNAFIWEDLMTGVCKDRAIVRKSVLDEFARKYRPSKLMAIKRIEPTRK